MTFKGITKTEIDLGLFFCWLNIVVWMWWIQSEEKGPFYALNSVPFSKEKLQQFLLPIYKMRLIGQKEHRGSGGLINLASPEGQKAKSSKAREFWVLLKIYIALSVSPKVWFFTVIKLLSHVCVTANIFCLMLHVSYLKNKRKILHPSKEEYWGDLLKTKFWIIFSVYFSMQKHLNPLI